MHLHTGVNTSFKVAVPTFLAPGTKTVFSWTWSGGGNGFRLIQVHYIYYAAADLTEVSDRNGSDGEQL